MDETHPLVDMGSSSYQSVKVNFVEHRTLELRADGLIIQIILKGFRIGLRSEICSLVFNTRLFVLNGFWSRHAIYHQLKSGYELHLSKKIHAIDFRSGSLS